ncbi:MAG: VWA domain-containing protein [Planctomycetales bacterium]
MSLDFINPLLLLGLAGIALPVLAHLLSKKKYDVVQWGAMQFLELGRNARRKVRLEQILLMLLRMGMIALVALAVSRPWLAGGCISSLVSTETRDVVFVIDGSYSMGWQGKAETPHAAAVGWAKKFLDELRPGDSIAVIDAREQPRAAIASPTRDFQHVRDTLDKLPEPSGSADLAAAVTKALQTLGRASSLSREVVVLGDGQARSWRAGDATLWTSIDALRQEPAVEPRIWVVDVARHAPGEKPNLSVERLQLSRQLTVPGFPVRVRTKVRYTGTTTGAATPRIHLHVDGQRIDDRTVKHTIPAEGEASVEFEYRFPSVGSHVLSVVLDEDDLPGDNAAHAAVTVAEAIPALLVDGDPQLEPTRSETWFAQKALTPATSATPWVRATVVPWDRFTRDSLTGIAVVFLANVPRIEPAQAEFLDEFVRHGGGLVVALGDKVDAESYGRLRDAEGRPLLPAVLEKIEEDTEAALGGVRVVDDSLQLPWLARFRAKEGDGFTEARYGRWWKLDLAAKPPAGRAGIDGDGAHSDDQTQAVRAARLNTGDPLLVSRRHGRGEILLFASSLDADWNTLPARPDYVSFLHETVFHLATGLSARNVQVGEPLLLPVPADLVLDDYAFHAPDGSALPPRAAGDELRPAARLGETQLAGIYEFRRRASENGGAQPGPGALREFFVVDFDRAESDLAVLDEPARQDLAAGDRLAFVSTLDELKAAMFTDSSRTEVWPLLLFVFLAILVGEVVMTRRLVQGGHEALDTASASVPQAASLDGFLSEVNLAMEGGQKH